LTEARVAGGSVNKFLEESFIEHLYRVSRHKLGLAGFDISNFKASPLRRSKSGRKFVIEYTLSLADRNRHHLTLSLIGKGRPEVTYRRTYALMDELWREGFDGRDDLRIVRPLAYLAPSRLLLTAKADGMNLKDLLLSNDPSASFYVGLAGRWLSKLHRANVKSAKWRPIVEEEETLNKWALRLGSLHPSCSTKVKLLSRHILETERSTSKCSALIHGDFHPSNIFVNGRSMTVIDFDASRFFEPAQDLGYFLAHLAKAIRRYHLPFDGRSLRENFLDGYAPEDREVFDRIGCYEARTHLQHLHYVYWTFGRELNAEEFEYWLDTAEASLRRGN